MLTNKKSSNLTYMILYNTKKASLMDGVSNLPNQSLLLMKKFTPSDQDKGNMVRH